MSSLVLRRLHEFGRFISIACSSTRAQLHTFLCLAQLHASSLCIDCISSVFSAEGATRKLMLQRLPTIGHFHSFYFLPIFPRQSIYGVAGVFFKSRKFLIVGMQKLCFLFQLLLSTSYFWRNYVDHNFDFNDDDDEELTGMLHELGSTWIFGNGTGMLPNIPQGDLFEERGPRRWKSGIIHPVGPDVHINVEDQKSFCEALYQLQKLKNEIDEREIVYSKFFYSFVICTEQDFSSSWSFYFKGSKRMD